MDKVYLFYRISFWVPIWGRPPLGTNDCCGSRIQTKGLDENCINEDDFCADEGNDDNALDQSYDEGNDDNPNQS